MVATYTFERGFELSGPRRATLPEALADAQEILEGNLPWVNGPIGPQKEEWQMDGILGEVMPIMVDGRRMGHICREVA